MSSPAERLYEQASRGDQAAVDALLVTYQPRLCAYLRLRAGGLLARESVSDLAQSVCRDVLENLDRFQFPGEANFRRWLYTTAARKLADRRAFWGAQRRDARRDDGAADVDTSALEAFVSVATPSRAAIAREELERVQRALDRLPDEQREAILLSRVLGLGRAEVAAVMGRTEGSVRMLICRGLAAVAGAAQREQ
ncbi:MAG: sigma-70 family RNA polymerase sigma factor [Planctomycetes bacterium]|nr:sigma-70 family RNA polymerase sigma factor [Planctomycetota bacterium]